MSDKKIPKIRFPEFTGDWEQRKLGELGEIVTGSTPSTTKSEYYSEDGIPWVTPTDINGCTISDTPRKLSEAGAKVGRVVPANTILCTCIASIGKNTLLTVKGSFNQQINGLTPYDENDAYFLLTESELWSNQMKRMAASGTMQIVNKKEFSELQTMVPSYLEQKIIGEYFSNLDNLITLHQRKCEKIKEYKKGCLQKMFPKEGEVVPEVRFPEFTGDWEQRKLEDIASFGGGHTPSMADSSNYENGNILWVTSQDVKSDYLSDTTTKISNKGASELRLYPQETLVMVTRSGILRHTLPISILQKPSTVNQDIRTISADESSSSLYLMQYFKAFSKSILKDYGKTGTTVESVDFAKMKSMEITLPSKEEQDKIGDFFYNLDNLIILHQRECEKYKELKKGLLQQMFV